MKAMNVPRLLRPICHASKPISLDQKQVYFSIFALGFAYYILAVASKKERYFIQKSAFIDNFRCVWGQYSVAIVRTSPS